MTSTKDKPAAAAIKDLLSHNSDGRREIVCAVMQVLKAEMTNALQAGQGERRSCAGSSIVVRSRKPGAIWRSGPPRGWSSIHA